MSPVTGFARDGGFPEVPAPPRTPVGHSNVMPMSPHGSSGYPSDSSWPASPNSDAHLMSPKSDPLSPKSGRLSQVMFGGRSASGLGLQKGQSSSRLSPEELEKRRLTNRQSAFDNPVREVEAFADVLSKQESLPFVDQLPWVSLVSAEVVGNLIILGVEADMKCFGHNCEAVQLPWPMVDLIFTLSGCLMLIVTVVSLGPRNYFCGDKLTGKGHIVRWIDIGLVFSRVLDVALSSLGFRDTNIKLISMLRIIHLSKLVRRLAPLRGFRELWLIFQGLGEAMRAVCFVIFLLLLILWVFGVAMTILWGRHPSTDFNYASSHFDKDDYWGTVPKSMLTLFEVFTKDRWAEVISRPLVEKEWLMALFFTLFLVITVLALSTTLVGVVVESALSSAAANEEKNGQEKQKFDAMVMNSLEEVFLEADQDRNGNLTRPELHRVLENGGVRSRLKLVEVSVSDLDLLFTLLDEEGLGQIKTTTFFRSCTRLRGDAMAQNTVQYMTDLVRHTKRCEDMEAGVQCANNALGSVLDQLAMLDKDVFKTEEDEKDPVIQARRARDSVPISQLLRQSPDSHIASLASTAYSPKHKGGRQGSRERGPSKKHQAPWGKFVPEPPPLPPHIQEEEEQEAAAALYARETEAIENKAIVEVRDDKRRHRTK